MRCSENQIVKAKRTYEIHITFYFHYQVTEPVIRTVNNLIDVADKLPEELLAEGGRIIAALEEQLQHLQRSNNGNYSQILENIGVASIRFEGHDIDRDLNLAHVVNGNSTRTRIGLDAGTIGLYEDYTSIPREGMTVSLVIPSEILPVLIDGKYKMHLYDILLLKIVHVRN